MPHKFKTHLQNHNLLELSSIPKSDLHNHAGCGGNVNYIASQVNVKIGQPPAVFESILHMHNWFTDNIKVHCSYLKRLEASFVQASDDNIHVLSMSFETDEANKIAGMDLGLFIQTMNNFKQSLAPSTIFLPELTFNRACCDVDSAYSRLDEILSYHWFKSLDICSDEFVQPIKNFKKIYKKAKDSGLRLKAHVGEFGTADDVMEAVEELGLDEVHHGIAAATSPYIMNWLADNRVQLNICPSSNVMLGVVKGYDVHPIRKLYDYGIPVTINTDDLLIFNQTVSQEYLNLYKAGLMTAEELNNIRELGLKEINYYV
ncbi:MAG TPA: adenosine deaminase [Mobilitalea sp.]|nr:adenosine deaminase [Mobilitalea sp.]